MGRTEYAAYQCVIRKHEELEEAKNMVQLHISDNRRRNLEQRAKLSLVNSITPFIDRMIHEVDRLMKGDDPEEVKQERYTYISELTDKSINIIRFSPIGYRCVREPSISA